MVSRHKGLLGILNVCVIDPSDSQYAIVLTPKPDGTKRFCTEFRKLNNITLFDSDPMSDTEAIFAKLAKSKYFIKIAFSKGY